MNLTFIGMPGAGKSTLGSQIAKRLGGKFIDVDERLEKKFALKLPRLIEKIGEKKFLKEEERLVLRLKKIKNCVISPGGSVVYSARAMKHLRKISLVIFLDAPFGVLKKRLANAARRERIIGFRSKNLKEIYRERRPLYQKYADLTVSPLPRQVFSNVSR